MKKNMKNIMIGIGSVFSVYTIGSIIHAGYKWGWGPCKKLHDLKMARVPGNAAEYDLSNISELPESRLKGKKILFLGSSVTYGAASQGVSFVDYIEKMTGCIAVKNAVSGTTLVDEGNKPYVSRLKEVKDTDIDFVVCQLSTNDASQKKELGQLTDSTDFTKLDNFNTHTIAGAMEYITAYSKNKWNDCDVMFYTNPKYDSEPYEKMVELAHALTAKWNTSIIDLWNNEEFNQISDEERTLYMADPIHPTKAGYLKWWTPFILGTGLLAQGAPIGS